MNLSLTQTHPEDLLSRKRGCAADLLYILKNTWYVLARNQSIRIPWIFLISILFLATFLFCSFPSCLYLRSFVPALVQNSMHTNYHEGLLLFLDSILILSSSTFILCMFPSNPAIIFMKGKIRACRYLPCTCSLSGGGRLSHNATAILLSSYSTGPLQSFQHTVYLHQDRSLPLLLSIICPLHLKLNLLYRSSSRKRLVLLLPHVLPIQAFLRVLGRCTRKGRGEASGMIG